MYKNIIITRDGKPLASIEASARMNLDDVAAELDAIRETEEGLFIELNGVMYDYFSDLDLLAMEYSPEDCTKAEANYTAWKAREIQRQFKNVDTDSLLNVIKAFTLKSLSRQAAAVDNPETVAKLRRDDLQDIINESYIKVVERVAAGTVVDKKTGEALEIWKIIFRSVNATVKQAWRSYYQHPTAAAWIETDDGEELCIIDIEAGPNTPRPAAPEAGTIAAAAENEILSYYRHDRGQARNIIKLLQAGYNETEIGRLLNISQQRISILLLDLRKAAEEARRDNTENESKREVIEKLRERQERENRNK